MTRSTRAMTASGSTRTVVSNPNSGPRRARWAISAALTRAFVGMHPTLIQVPPSAAGSASSTRAPRCAARSVALIPPIPPPTTTRSGVKPSYDRTWVPCPRCRACERGWSATCRAAGPTSGSSSRSSGRSTSPTRAPAASPTARATRPSRNANRVIDAERALGIFWELDIQNWALNAPGFVEFTANRTYFACQFLISYGFMLWAYFRRNHAWYFMRNVLIVAGFIGLIGYVAFPTAPPRMFPELGFVDTLNGEAVSHQTGIVETFANPYAAMPSLHTAYALIIGTSGFLVCRHLLLKILGLLPRAGRVLDRRDGQPLVPRRHRGRLRRALRGDRRPGADPRRRPAARREPAGPLVRERRRSLRTPAAAPTVPAGAD